MKVYQYNSYAMGTRFNLVIPGLDDAEGHEIGSGVSKILSSEENRLSRYREESEISLLNQMAFNEDVLVSEEMQQILDACDYYHKATLGAFDPALPALTSSPEQPGPTAPQTIEKAYPGWSSIRRENNSIRYLRPDTGIDLGGFGKGWALEKILEYLGKQHIASAFISFGESAISVIGNHPLGNPWLLEIPNPFTQKPLVLNLSDESISLSGLKIKNTPNGTHFQSHIFSPEKGTMIDEERMVLVKGATPLQVEVLSTAVLAAGIQQKNAIFDAFSQLDFFECRGGEWKTMK